MQVYPMSKQYTVEKAQQALPIMMYHSSTPPPYQYTNQYFSGNSMLQPGFAPVLQSTMLAPQFQQAINQSAYPIYLQDNSFIQLMSTKQFSESMPMFNLQVPVASRTFDQVCADSSLTFCPSQLGLIPSSTWSSDIISFGSLVQNFFRRRNSSASKFPYKLFNALRITEVQPEYFPHIGVKWVDDNIIWVNREAFARLIGVKTIEGGLFHQQGNFPSHGFIELSYEESEAVAAHHKLGHVDLSQMRMVRHSGGVFKRGCTESDLEKCKWKGA